jgi:hypothetical protein
MQVKKYKAKGKKGRVFPIQFTKHDNIPYQSFTLKDSDQIFSYFGGTDISLIPDGTEMEFQYELRGKYANVREIIGFDHLPKLDKKALKDDYLKEMESEQSLDQMQEKNQINNRSENMSKTNPRSPEQIEYEKPFVRVHGQDRDQDWVSKDMELKIKMNAGNTTKEIIGLACNASARYEDGSMNEDSFWKYYDILMDAYDQGVDKVSGITLGYKTDLKEDEETEQKDEPNGEQTTSTEENRPRD